MWMGGQMGRCRGQMGRCRGQMGRCRMTRVLQRLYL